MNIRVKKISNIGYQKYPSLLPHNTVLRAAWLMLSGGISSVPVCSDNKLTGIISYHDVAKLFLPNFHIIKENKQVDSHKLFLRYPKQRVSQYMTKNVLTANPEDDVEKIIKILSQRYFVGNGIEIKSKSITSVPIVDDINFDYLGSVTYFDILDAIDLPSKLNVGSIMNQVYPTVSKYSTIHEAHFILNVQLIRNIVVVDESGEFPKPVGVISDNQILRCLHPDFSLKELLVKDVMTDLNILPSISPYDSISKVIGIFCNRDFGIKTLPVTEKEKIVGTISYLDIFHHLTN
jgi:CBS domain-containing protein